MKIHRTHGAFDEYSLNGVPFDDQASRSMNIHRTGSAFDESFIQRALLHEFFVSIFFGGNLNITISFTCLEARPNCQRSPSVQARPPSASKAQL